MIRIVVQGGVQLRTGRQQPQGPDRQGAEDRHPAKRGRRLLGDSGGGQRHVGRQDYYVPQNVKRLAPRLTTFGSQEPGVVAIRVSSQGPPPARVQTAAKRPRTCTVVPPGTTTAWL